MPTAPWGGCWHAARPVCAPTAQGPCSVCTRQPIRRQVPKASHQPRATHDAWETPRRGGDQGITPPARSDMLRARVCLCMLNKDTQVFSYVSQGSTCSNLKYQMGDTTGIFV